MSDKQIQMVDLHGQYLRLKKEIDAAMQSVIESSAFINGPQVKTFAGHLGAFLDIPYVVTCANGTDALQIALMALELRPGDEVILPAFTYVAAAEVVALLGCIPVLVDVDPRTFNINPTMIEAAISSKTKAIIAVHLFGQSCDMDAIMKIADAYRLFVIEDNAQSIGASYTFPDGRVRKTGTIGHIGTTSFFPSKPLACYGDGGAVMTSDPVWGERIRMIANHGQERKYHHKVIGCNSRLDTLQAAILDVKLSHLSDFTKARQSVASAYDAVLSGCKGMIIPEKSGFSTHIYHQYTIQVEDAKRDSLQALLKAKGIPTMIYYPLPLHVQEGYRKIVRMSDPHTIATRLSQSVLSLPIHTEMDENEIQYITETIVETTRAVENI